MISAISRRVPARGILALALVAGAGVLWLASAPSGRGATATSSPTLSASVTKTISWSTQATAPSITADGTFSADTPLGAVTSNAIWQVTLSSTALTCTFGSGCANAETIPNSAIDFKYIGSGGGAGPPGSSAGACNTSCTLSSAQALFTSATKGTAVSNGTGDYKVTPGSASGGDYTGTLTFTASN
jgi:hypothetical protein